MKKLSFWSSKYSRRAFQFFASRIYINPEADPRLSILVAGTARSGTTWLGDLIAAQIPCRILFEPFNPDLVPEYRNFQYFQYMCPGTVNAEFFTFANKVFTGEIRNRWIDRQNEKIFSKYRLIKEIRANLVLKWLHDNFPMVPIVLLIRHPCAVVLSRMELGWATDSDIQPFLLQTRLIEDHLSPYMDLIRNAKTVEEKHAIIWSISYLIPLKQFRPGEIQTVYYEKLCVQPEKELPVILKSLGQSNPEPILKKVYRPSQTTRETSAIVAGQDKLSNWKRKLTPAQIDNIYRVVETFGLDYMYGDSYLPLEKEKDVT